MSVRTALRAALAALSITFAVAAAPALADESPLTPLQGAAAAPAKTAADVVGQWRITNAKLMSGAAYTGNVAITAKGDFYEVAWNLPNQPPYGGVGFIVGDELAVGWGTGKDYGVVVYDVAGGKLTGSWTVKGASARGTENLDGPAGLNGTYKITKATTPTGGTYAGEVQIKPNGATHELLWRVGKDSYKGVGVLHGSKLLVGWSVGGGAGVVVYKIQPKKLDGVWSNPGEGKTSIEVLGK